MHFSLHRKAPALITGERILVVDDAPDILEVLHATLEDSDFQVIGAPNGRTAPRKFYEFHRKVVGQI